MVRGFNPARYYPRASGTGMIFRELMEVVMFKKARMVLWILSFIVAVAPAAHLSASEFTIMQGRLIDEDCLLAKKNPCPLENFTGQRLVLLTLDEVAYRIQPQGIADFKLNNAYGQVVVVKGMKQGDTIRVADLFRPEKALTKA